MLAAVGAQHTLALKQQEQAALEAVAGGQILVAATAYLAAQTELQILVAAEVLVTQAVPVS